MPRRSRALRLLGRLLLAVGAALALSATTAGPAQAHATLVSSDPSDGISLSAAPARVTLNLSEAVEASRTRAVLTDGAGRVVPVTAVHVRRSGAGALVVAGVVTTVPTTVVVDLPPLPPDVYHLAWSTLSSDDLHTTGGVVVFGVQTPVATHVPAPEPTPSSVEVAVRWGSLVALGLLVGALLLPLGPVGGRRLLGLGAAGGLTAVALDLALLRLQLGGSGLLPAGAWGQLAGSGYAARWAVRELAVAGLVLLALLARHRPARAAGRAGRALASALVLLAALGAALTGHVPASASSGFGLGGAVVRTGTETLHLAAATVWVGALLGLLAWPLARPLARPLTRPLAAAGGAGGFRQVLGRVSPYAVGSVAVLVVTGLLLAGDEVATLDALLFTGYGRTLLVKVGLVAGALVLGGMSAAAARPQWLPARWRARAAALPVRRLLAAEAAAALLVVAAAAALAAAQPANGRGWSADTFAEPLLSGQPQDLVETVQVSPNRPGRNFVTVDVFNTRRPEPGPITAVTLTLSNGGRSVTAPAVAQGEGRWLLATDELTTSGQWDVTVRVTRDGLPDTVARYPWAVAEPSARLQHTVVSSAPLGAPLGLAAGLVGLLALLGAGLAASRRRAAGPQADRPGGGQSDDAGGTWSATRSLSSESWLPTSAIRAGAAETSDTEALPERSREASRSR